MSSQNFIYEAKGECLVIHLPKELDHHNCRNLRYETDLILAEHYISKIIFDFSRTEFMDSSGIGVLLSRYKQMDRSGGRVVLYGVGTQIERILAIGGVLRLAETCSTKEAAIKLERSRTWK
ncbi:MAG: anti-sigma factor antagonist [bacterium]|nr:anti-sigma factor antagonist [bacterium]